MQPVRQIARLGAKGQGIAEYALLIALIAVLVIALVALLGLLVDDILAIRAEVLGSQCTPALQMVYTDRRYTPGDFQPGGISFVRPASGRLSQRTWTCHHAIDIVDPTGTPIYAAGAGVVIKASLAGYTAYGRMVVIRHAHGYQTVYGHLSRSYVRPGQYVAKGADDWEYGEHRSIHRPSPSLRGRKGQLVA